jgi:deazaflavin-dependent oxidoreductase (nitroreductase family)
MAYLKPNAFAKNVFNPIAKKFGLSGTNELIVRRRKSGEDQSVPVIPVEYDGSRYVVSTRGESEWVRNVRAAGVLEVRNKQGSERLTATELPVAERAPIIASYREKAGRTVETYWKKLPDDADHPVFRIEPG